MFLLHYLLLFIKAIQFIVVLQVLMSWFPKLHQNSFYAFLHEITAPLYRFIKNIPHRFGMIDLSPLLLLLALDLLTLLIRGLL